ncbi:ABC transporter permease [Mesorhizobium sp. B283B1A]|uniref:ABC transporter permease n=1 Tax=Mesorhizobium TaxID=68287 RepID=UPI001CD12EC4|nr:MULTISPECIES: ABC transporter permease [Mesorhizobium]MCA0048036.1 ABC transporter permease [Mesorhizobium sp. B283B1A]UQS63830.1 ABC transporter permease [Mesorhizobium opportunistum]WJI39579.1 ABC transporter permease [Mesorhizobium opportunistum]
MLFEMAIREGLGGSLWPAKSNAPERQIAIPQTMIAALNGAFDDISRAMRLHRVWVALAQEDIGDQHRRTTLGPLWLLVNYVAFVGTFVFVFQPAGKDAAGYAAYVAIGLLVWFYLMEVMSLSVSLFQREESFIEGTTLPLFVYVMRLALQSAIRAGYAIAGCLVILLLSGSPVATPWLWSLAGLFLILFATPALITVFAFLGAFFPDSQFIVGNLLRVGMFFTPVFWVYNGQDPIQKYAYEWNPFTYFLEIVRLPIMTGEFPAHAFTVTIIVSLAIWMIALLLLGRYRKQVIFII